MQVQINPGPGVSLSEALEKHIHDKLAMVDKRFGDRVTRVEVFLKDIRGPKGGVDKHCAMEARPEGLEPVGADGAAEDMYAAIKETAEKLTRVLEHRFGRLQDRS